MTRQALVSAAYSYSLTASQDGDLVPSSLCYCTYTICKIDELLWWEWATATVARFAAAPAISSSSATGYSEMVTVHSSLPVAKSSA